MYHLRIEQRKSRVSLYEISIIADVSFNPLMFSSVGFATLETKKFGVFLWVLDT